MAAERIADIHPSQQGSLKDSDLLLLLLAAPGPTGHGSAVAGVTRLMKLLFLAGQEAGFTHGENFEFEPYRYGPFSRDVYGRLRSLITHGLIEARRTGEPDFYQALELRDAR